jgi:hypothetical protein
MISAPLPALKTAYLRSSGTREGVPAMFRE